MYLQISILKPDTKKFVYKCVEGNDAVAVTKYI